MNAGILAAGIASVANTSGAFGNNSAVTLANVASAALNLTGFNTQLGSLTGGGATGGNVTLGGAVLSVGGDSTTPAPYAGSISGSGGLTKIGTGVWSVTGNSTYTGPTTVSTGKLYLDGTDATSTIAVAGGATLGGTGSAALATATIADTGILEAGAGGTGSLTLAGLLFSNTAVVNVGSLANYAANAAILVTGNGLLDVGGGTGSVVVDITSLAGAITNVPYGLIGHAGPIAGAGLAGFTVPLPNRTAGSVTDSGTAVDLTLAGSDFLKWTGLGDLANGWDTVTPNWVLNSNGNATDYINSPGDDVVFDDTAGAADTTVGINASNVSPHSVTFNNSTDTYTLQARRSNLGSDRLDCKTGTGTTILATNDSYSGLTAINAGTLDIENANAPRRRLGNHRRSRRFALQIQGGITTAAAIDAERNRRRLRRCSAQHLRQQYFHRSDHARFRHPDQFRFGHAHAQQPPRRSRERKT